MSDRTTEALVQFAVDGDTVDKDVLVVCRMADNNGDVVFDKENVSD